MIAAQNKDRTPDKKLSAVCGLFCPSCTVYIASMYDRARLQKLASRFSVTVEEMECHGCRSDKRGLYCNKRCKMSKCAAEKGIEFCGECKDYPCTELKEFQSQMPHRNGLWASQRRIKESGLAKWYSEMLEQYSCLNCGTINSAYDMACRNCATTPSCYYASVYEKEVIKHRDKMGP
jgi:hypothetical protein